MTKWVFRMIMMAAFGGALIVAAQRKDGGQPEKKMPVQAEAGIRAAEAESSEGTAGRAVSNVEGDRMQSGKEKAVPSGLENGMQSDKEPVRKELTDMYFQAFCELMQMDPGLGEDTAYFGFDFSKAGSLTQSEKGTLAGRLKRKYYKSNIIFGTWEELKEAGYIEEKELCWKDGLLLTLEVTEEKKNCIVFSISAWRSGDGAVGKDDCQAERGKNGIWKVNEEKTVKCWVA